MEYLQDLFNSVQDTQKLIKRWESDNEFRKQHSITKHLLKLETFVANQVALNYYLLDNQIILNNGSTNSLYEAMLKLRILQSIRKVAAKDNNMEAVKLLDIEIDDYNTKIAEKMKSVKLVKPR